jgi:hypothetical protein
MSEEIRKKIEQKMSSRQLDIILRKLVDPNITQIDASGLTFDDESAIKIGETLPYAFVDSYCFV